MMSSAHRDVISVIRNHDWEEDLSKILASAMPVDTLGYLAPLLPTWINFNPSIPTRRQAIIWTSDGYFTDAFMYYSASVS